MKAVYNMIWTTIKNVWNTLASFDIGGITYLEYALLLIIVGIILSGLLNTVKNDYKDNLSRNKSDTKKRDDYK